ncbi:MAG: UbiA-like polyprenyltransferase [Pirellulales bacterium]
MLTRLRHFLEMIRFSHTLFALPFALLAAVMAWWQRSQLDQPWRVRELAGIVLCMVFARSAAMATNRLADRRFDAANPRTTGRHLPQGILTGGAVAGFAIGSGLGFVGSTLLFLPNRWPIYLAVPILAFLCAYSFTKRFTWLSHFWLGAALMLAPAGAWIAIRAAWDWPPVVLAGAVLFWVAGFDIIYACQDVEFDRRTGLKSVPARWGVAGALRVAAGCHAAMLGLLLLLPAVFPLGWIYLAGVIGIAGLLAYEHLLVRPDDLARVNVAFFHVNAVVSVGLLAVGAADLWLWR